MVFLFLLIFSIFLLEISDSKNYYFNKYNTNNNTDGSSENPFKKLSQIYDIKKEFSERLTFIFLSDLNLDNLITIPFFIKFLTIQSYNNKYKILFATNGKIEINNTETNFFNVEFNSLNFLGSNELFLIYSTYNVTFQNMILNSNTLIKSQNSSISIENCKITNLSNFDTILFMNSFWENNNYLIISFTIFYNCINIDNYKNNGLFDFREINSIVIANSNFVSITSTQNIFYILRTKIKIEIYNSIFLNNINKIQSINIEYATNINLTNVICDYVNQQFNKNILGGCFRSVNSFLRFFNNVSINNGFSNLTTVGIKIIDNSINLIKFREEVNYFEEFNNNSISSSPKSAFLASSPCIISYSQKTVLFISKSIFLDNHSRFGSNCITFLGQSCNINEIKMLNNTCINASRNDLMSLELGGGFLMKGNLLIVINSIFIENAASYGGVFVFQNKYLDLIIDNCFFDNNYAFMGGSIYFTPYLIKTNIVIKNCIFTRNYANRGGAIIFLAISKNFYSKIFNSIFINNIAEVGGCTDTNLYEGFILFEKNNYFLNKVFSKDGVGSGSVHKIKFNLIGNSQIVSQNCIYLDNIGQARGVIIIFSGFYKELNSIFMGNYGFDGGTFYTVQKVDILMENCTFKNEYAKNRGGSIVLTDNSDATFKNSLFSNCSSDQKGGIFVIIELCGLKLINSIITNISSNFGGILYTEENYNIKIVIINCHFKHNKGVINLIDSFNSIIHINDTIFEDNTNNLFSITFTIFEASNITISNHTCYSSKQGCLLSGIENSIITINFANINNIISQFVNSNIFLEKSKLFIYNSQFKNLFTKEPLGSCIYSISSSLILFDCLFITYFSNCIKSENNGSIIINNTLFNNTKNEIFSIYSKFGTISCISCNNLEINFSGFYNNKKVSEGASIYLFSFESMISNINLNFFKIFNNYFTNNEVYTKGGSIYILNSKIKLINNTFFNNFANFGGAIFTKLDLFESEIFIENNIFLKNIAKEEGGAIKWENNMPKINVLNIFKDNTGKYGNDIAAYPIKLLLQYFETQNEEKSEIIKYDSLINDTILTIYEINSGNKLLGKLKFKIADIYNEIVIVDEGLITISWLDIYKNNSTPLIIDGSTEKTFKSGISIFDDLSFFYLPNSFTKLKITCDLIKKFDQSNPNPSFESNINGEYNFFVNIHFRKCDYGEIYLVKYQKCQICNIGEYSLENGMIAKNCKKCPQFVNFCYKNILNLKPGYWRSSIDSENIYNCGDFEDKCLGGSNISCTMNHEGPFCSICATGYSMIGLDCKKCDNATLNTILLSIAIFGICVFLSILTYASIKQSDKLLKLKNNTRNENIKYFKGNLWTSKKGFSIYQKIFLNFLQMTAIVHGMNLKWPYYVNNYLNIYSIVGNASSTLFSTGCFFYDYKIGLNSLYANSIIIVVFPLIFILIIALFLLFLYISSKKNQTSRLSSSVIIIGIYFQPSIIQKLFQNLKCKRIDGADYISTYLSIECYTDSYNNWIINFIIPLFILWVIIYPLSFLIYLCVNKKNLNSFSLRANAGYFVNGYQRKYFYWEFIILLKKILLISANLIEGNNSFKLKSTLLLFIALFFLFLTMYFQPFMFDEFNTLELYSSLSAFIIIYAGNLYILYINDSFKALLFVFVLFVNCIFTLRWGVSLFTIIIDSYRHIFFKYFPKLTRSFIFLLSKTIRIGKKKSIKNKNQKPKQNSYIKALFKFKKNEIIQKQ